MRKIIASLLLVSTLAFWGGISLVQAQKPDIPEKDGVYNDPDHPGIKVRVFVHNERPARNQAPALACSDDLNSNAVVHSAGWKLSPTWEYNLNVGSVPSSVGSGNLATIASNGFSDWRGASGNKITFLRGVNTTTSRQAYDSKNIIAWGRTQGTALGVTYIRYYPDTGQVVDVDTIMNKKFTWKWANSNTCADTSAYDAENILTHELGHWVGLDDEYTSDFVNNTMYGYGSKGEVKKNTLTTGDQQGTLAIYQ